MKNNLLFFVLIFLITSINLLAQETGTFTDTRDDQIYQTVKIGKQEWMAENLSYNPVSGSWVYDNNSSNESIYGRLYDWETAKAICPAGWHLPTSDEWFVLTRYLGGGSIAGAKLKEIGTTHWEIPNDLATNETGFIALPGGACINDGASFDLIGYRGFWWSANEVDTDTSLAYFRVMGFNNNYVSSIGGNKRVGFSVRCVRD